MLGSILVAKILTPPPLLLSNLSLNEPSGLMSCALIGLRGNNKIHMIKLLAVAVQVAVNYVCTKTKQLNNIKISTFIFVGGGPYFDVKYGCLFPIHNGYHQNFW